MGKNLFPLARMRDSFQNYVSTRREKEVALAEMSEKSIRKAFLLARKSPSTNRNAFKNTFPKDREIKPAVVGVSQNGRKKQFSLARKSVSTNKNKVIFQKLDLPVFTSRKKISK